MELIRFRFTAFAASWLLENDHSITKNLCIRLGYTTSDTVSHFYSSGYVYFLKGIQNSFSRWEMALSNRQHTYD